MVSAHQIEGAGGGTPIAPGDQNANARGSFVDLYFDHHVPELTGPELKQTLRPYSISTQEIASGGLFRNRLAKVKDAIKNHKILVGMNHEMVMYSKGRAPKKSPRARRRKRTMKNGSTANHPPTSILSASLQTK
jgi:hypothetical protein